MPRLGQGIAGKGRVKEPMTFLPSETPKHKPKGKGRLHRRLKETLSKKAKRNSDDLCKKRPNLFAVDASTMSAKEQPVAWYRDFFHGCAYMVHELLLANRKNSQRLLYGKGNE